MKKTLVAVFLTVNLFAAFAHADNDSIAEMCRLEAVANELSGEDLAAYVKDCVEETMNAQGNAGSVEAPAEGQAQ